MGRLTGLAALTLAAGLAAGCGDPVVILGDWPGTMRIVAGVPDSAGLAFDTALARRRLNSPRGLAVDGEGVLYIADQGLERIVAVHSSGERRVLASRASCAAAPCLSRPDGLALDGRGGLLITEPDSQRIWRLELAGGGLERIAGSGQAGAAADGTRASAAALQYPTGIAAGADGRIYFTERGGQRVRVILPDGRLGTIAGTGMLGFAGDGGPATAARLHAPAGVALGGVVLYIADSGNHRIRAVDLTAGTIRSLAGSGAAGFGGDGAPALEAQLDRPEGLALSADGRVLFIADSNNHRVRAIGLHNLLITTYAGTGDRGYNGDGRAAGETALNRPVAVATSTFNLLFISATGHHIVWRSPIGI